MMFAMNFWQRMALFGCAIFLGLPASAQQTDGMHWLARVVTAAHRLNYTGTFVYRNAALSETSRIAHFLEAGRELERLEVLNGDTREIIRINDEVRYYLPQRQTLIVEKRGLQRNFPALLPASLTGLTESYTIHKGGRELVAGRESQIIRLEPRDIWRYGQKLWVDVESGLLLRADMLDERNESIESFAFTQLQIGEGIDRNAHQSKFDAALGSWRVRAAPHLHHLASARRSAWNDGGPVWMVREKIPGFRIRSDMKRVAQADRPECVHMVFSDGLVAISVFIEAASQDSQPESGPGAEKLGALNVYRRVLGKHLVVLMGEVPLPTLRKLGDSIEAKPK